MTRWWHRAPDAVPGFSRAPLGAGTELDVPMPAGGRWRDLGLGLSTNLMNPKVGVFYVVFGARLAATARI
ncbi:hypothetical protein LEP48_07865 [Isoptericola sp. NEAU-Y5]|uniref:Uncharacterized protein n=1 Tax=Isoptericola luteus TaxID=2879484 RepID=A0ABS7ZE10_9MICO|nr:hypothetical protein [Isoptericola sp. NEAU-Y5]MCA5893275.1 hypothetical protein [Isoptericola sp. NEAU-Y5]